MGDAKVKGQEAPVRGMEYGYMRTVVGVRQTVHPIRVRDNDETLEKLYKERLSIARRLPFSCPYSQCMAW